MTLPFCRAESGTADGDALLADIKDRPGSWSRMCASPPPVAFDVPVPLSYSHVPYRHFGLARDGLKRAVTNRQAVVGALKKAMAGMDLRHPPASASTKPTDTWERSGLMPDWFNAIHLELIRDLQIVEALPELLRLEAQLSDLLEAAGKDPGAPLPALPLDSPAGMADDKEKARDW